MESTKHIDGIVLMKLISKLLERKVINEQTFKTLLYKMQPTGIFILIKILNLVNKWSSLVNVARMDLFSFKEPTMSGQLKLKSGMKMKKQSIRFQFNQFLIQTLLR